MKTEKNWTDQELDVSSKLIKVGLIIEHKPKLADGLCNMLYIDMSQKH